MMLIVILEKDLTNALEKGEQRRFSRKMTLIQFVKVTCAGAVTSKIYLWGNAGFFVGLPGLIGCYCLAGGRRIFGRKCRPDRGAAEFRQCVAFSWTMP